MPKKILFVDLTHPKAYDPQRTQQQAVGGTEASLMRTAAILAKEHTVCVAQQARGEPTDFGTSLSYRPLPEALAGFAADEVVVLRKFSALKGLRQRYPQAGLHLWLHTCKKAEFSLKKPVFQSLGVSVVGNSRTHRDHLHRVLNESLTGRLLGLGRQAVPVHFAYNPIPQPKVRTGTSRDPNKLIFLSSPNKGLDQVLQAFRQVRKQLPALRLYVANPGYRPHADTAQESGVVSLGALPHAELMQHLAESLCLFYPQDSFAETFGLVYAEANALGVPVLACDVGAAREIVHPANPLVVANDYAGMVNLIRDWQQQPPAVAYRDIFSEAAVQRQWDSIFAGDLPGSAPV